MAKRKRKKHRKIFRIVPFVLFAATVVTVYVFAENISSFCCRIVDDTVKSAGFVVESINISGANKKTEQLIQNNIQIEKGDNIFKISSNEIFDNVKKVPWIEKANVKKILPNTIDIKVEQKVPMAVFQHDSVFTLVDKAGNFIEDAAVLPKNLPIIAGQNANLEFKNILDLIEKYEPVKRNLSSMTFVRERRWDIFVCGGIQVKLPDQNVEKALGILSNIIDKNKFNGNNVESIDLRTKDNTIIRGLRIKMPNKNVA